MGDIISFRDYKNDKCLNERLYDKCVDGFLEAQRVVNAIHVEYEDKYSYLFNFRELRSMGYIPSEIRKLMKWGYITEESDNFNISYDILGEWGVNTTGKFRFHKDEKVQTFWKFYEEVWAKYASQIHKLKLLKSSCVGLIAILVGLMFII